MTTTAQTVTYSDIGNKRDENPAGMRVRAVERRATDFATGEIPEALCTSGHCQCPEMETGAECETAVAEDDGEEMTLGELADKQATSKAAGLRRVWYVLDAAGKEQIWWAATVERVG